MKVEKGRREDEKWKMRLLGKTRQRMGKAEAREERKKIRERNIRKGKKGRKNGKGKDERR